MSKPLLTIEDLTINVEHISLVKNINLVINKSEAVALVGESGSGKSLTASSILKLLPSQIFNYPSGKILFNDTDLLSADEKTLRQIRGNKISMIFQDPMMSLNPLHTIEKQLYEVLKMHSSLSHNQYKSEIVSYLDRVGIKNAQSRLKSYPHELSGGERQRVMIAMAILTKPDLLIADEPTTALDVTVQSQIINLLDELKKELNMSLLLISHNLSIVKKVADKIAVMKQGEIVEFNTRTEVYLRSKHPYTQTLLNTKYLKEPNPLAKDASLLFKVDNLSVAVDTKKGFFKKQTKKLVNNVSFEIKEGETLGIVGESGSGKTTTAMAVLRLIKSQGSIYLRENQLDLLNNKKMLPFRHKIQVVFQDPFSSLNPKFTIEQIISEGLIAHHKLSASAREQKVINILNEVGVDPNARHRYPDEFSGGQRQRIAIARALILEPELVVLDEPTSSLDKAVQIQIIELLSALQQKHKLSYLFISHDLSLVYAFCHQVIVLKEGMIVEHANREAIFNSPKHPYTQLLLSFWTKPMPDKPRINQKYLEEVAKLNNKVDNPNTKDKAKVMRDNNWSEALLVSKNTKKN